VEPPVHAQSKKVVRWDEGHAGVAPKTGTKMPKDPLLSLNGEDRKPRLANQRVAERHTCKQLCKNSRFCFHGFERTMRQVYFERSHAGYGTNDQEPP